MKSKIFISLVLLLFGLTFLATGGALAAKKARHRPPLVERLDGAEPPEAYRVPSPVMYEVGVQPDCEDIHPTIGYDYVIQHDLFGWTYYDKQRNGSMGRMIAVGPAGHRHMMFHETRDVYPPGPRWITYNCKDPLGNWLGSTHADSGELNAGYGNIDVLRDGRAVLNHHRTAGDPRWYTVLAVEDSVCGGSFTNIYDVPDYFEGRYEQGMWPKMCVCPVGDTDFMHIVMTEGKTTGGNQYLGYLRCHLITGGNLVCETPDNGQQGVVTPVTLAPNTAGGGELSPIAYFGRCTHPDCEPTDYPNDIALVAVSSPVSRKVAVVFVNKKESGDAQWNNDVFYFESDSNGYEWFPQYGGCWPPEDCGMVVNITQYPEDYPERAYTDVGACYDHEDNLHIVWNSCEFDPVQGLPVSFNATLMHWCNTEPPGINNATIVAPAYWDDGTYSCGAWNRNISKMSISAKDPVYHPGEPPYLFCTWTQFGPDDVAVSEYANGDICAAVSNDGGATWSASVNLTNTKTPDCDPDTGYPCLSEHYSSLAENLYGADLHIQYVCDRDAGRANGGEGIWTDNPMMYLHVEQFPMISPPQIQTELVDPPSWTHPPIKVLPDSSRIIVMQVKNTGNLNLNYEVFTYNPYVVVVSGGSGTVYPEDSIYVEIMINCPGETFLTDTVVVASDDTTNPHIVHRLHAVCSDDYYECDRDSATWIEKDNSKIKAKFWVNSEERVWDQRIVDEDKQKVIFSASPIAATTWQGDTVVGRQDWRDVLTGARDTIHHVVGIDPLDSNCALQVVWNHNTFICANNLPPPNHQRWWWINFHQQIFMWDDTLGECPNWKKEQIIKQIWIDRIWWYPTYPAWWPFPGGPPAEEYEDIWFGWFADVDAPWDEGGNGYNYVGYDAAREMVWFHGWYNDTLPEGHPEYEDYYVGLTFTDREGNVVEPLGMQVVLNDSFLHPQDGWGWLDGELYQLASTPGVNIHHPDSVTDRSVVMNRAMVPAGTGYFESEYILIEAFSPTGLADLQAHIDSTREILIPHLDWPLWVFRMCPICGDCNEDGVVSSADIVFLIGYLFHGGPEPRWPIGRGNVNYPADEVINSADIVYLINYLFKGGPPPNCPGFGRE